MSALTAKLTASVLLIEDGKCLVLEELDDDGTRKFNLPGGHVDPGETPLEAAVREAKEETGYDVAVGALLVVQAITRKETHTAKYIFLGRRLGGEETLEPGTVAHWLDAATIQAIPKDRWIRQMDQVLLWGLEGHAIDPRAAMFYRDGERL